MIKDCYPYDPRKKIIWHLCIKSYLHKKKTRSTSNNDTYNLKNKTKMK